MYTSQILAHNYPTLRAYLGDVAFGKLALSYSAAHPFHQANTRWLLNSLPEFIRSHTEWKTRPEVAEVAELTRAFDYAFAAPDLPSLKQDCLAKIKPEELQTQRLHLHPSTTILSLHTNAASIWSALKCEEAPPRAFNLGEPQTILVWRQGSNARFRVLGDEEAMALSAVGIGMNFRQLCEMIAAAAPEDAALHAASYLRGWIEADVLLAPERP